MDIDTMVLSNARNWDGILSDSRNIINHATQLLAHDHVLRALQMQMVPTLHAHGIVLTHSPIFSVRSSPAFFKADPKTGKSVLDYQRMYHTITMSVHPFLFGSQQRSCITLLELHVQPRCNWNLDHQKLSRAVLGKFMEVCKIQTKAQEKLPRHMGIFIPNVKQMIKHANKVIGNRKPHQVAKIRSDKQRFKWFIATIVDPIAKMALSPKGMGKKVNLTCTLNLQATKKVQDENCPIAKNKGQAGAKGNTKKV